MESSTQSTTESTPRRPWREPPADDGEAFRKYIESDEPHHRETSYRRGFHQGASEALRMIAAGFTVEQANRWLGTVQRWRFRKITGALPPVAGEGAQR